MCALGVEDSLKLKLTNIFVNLKEVVLHVGDSFKQKKLTSIKI